MSWLTARLWSKRTPALIVSQFPNLQGVAGKRRRGQELAAGVRGRAGDGLEWLAVVVDVPDAAGNHLRLEVFPLLQ